MFHFSEDLNETQFFLWDKKLIENKNWANLSKSAKCVFPVIACHCNQTGMSFPGEETLSALSGRSEKIVREGILNLQNFPGFRWEYYTTKRGRRSKKFFLTFPPKKRGQSFPFYRFILESGIWQNLRPSSQALYPVMRLFGFFDLELYSDEEEIEEEFHDYKNIYKQRDYDFCVAKKGNLVKYAGIARRSMPRALRDLEDNFLIEPLEENKGWKVFLRSENNTYWKRDCLNSQIRKHQGGKNYRS